MDQNTLQDGAVGVEQSPEPSMAESQQISGTVNLQDELTCPSASSNGDSRQNSNDAVNNSHQLVVIDEAGLTTDKADGVPREVLCNQTELLSIDDVLSDFKNSSPINKNAYIDDGNLISFDNKSRNALLSDDVKDSGGPPKNETQSTLLDDLMDKQVLLSIQKSLQDRDNNIFEKTFICDDSEDPSVVLTKYADNDEVNTQNKTIDIKLQETDIKMNEPSSEVSVTKTVSDKLNDPIDNTVDNKIAEPKVKPVDLLSKINPSNVCLDKEKSEKNKKVAANADYTKDSYVEKIRKPDGEIASNSVTDQPGDVIDKIQAMPWLKNPPSTDVPVNQYSRLSLRGLPKKEDCNESYYEGTKKNPNRRRQGRRQSTANLGDQPLVENEPSENVQIIESPQHLIDNSQVKETKQAIPTLVDSNSAVQQDKKGTTLEQEKMKLSDNDKDWDKNNCNLPENLKNVCDGNDANSDTGPFDKFGRLDGHTEKHMFMGKGGRRREQEAFKSFSENDPGALRPRPSDEIPAKKDVQFNNNRERPIHGRSGSDMDFDSQKNKNQKTAPKPEVPRSQQNQIPSNRRQDNQRTPQSLLYQNQNSHRNVDGFDRYQDRSFLRLRQPARDKSQGISNKSQMLDNTAQGSRTVAQNSAQKDQGNNNNKTQDNHHEVQRNHYGQDDKNRNSNRNQNYPDRCKDVSLRNRDQQRNRNPFKNNQDADMKQDTQCRNMQQQQQRGEIVKNREKAEEYWNPPLENVSNKNEPKNSKLPEKQKISVDHAKQALVKTQENSKLISNTVVKQESENKVNILQNQRRGSNSSLNKVVVAPVAAKEPKPEIVKSKDTVNQSLNSGLKPNLVMAFEGNQNVQCALGIDPSKYTPVSTTIQANVSVTTPAYTSVDTSPTNDCHHSYLGINKGSSRAFESFSNAKTFQNQDPSTQYSVGVETQAASTKSSAYYNYGGSSLSNHQISDLEMYLIEKILKEGEIVATAKRYLATSEANLFATQSKLEELRSHFMENQSQDYILDSNNHLIRSESECSFLGTPFQYSPQPLLSPSLPSNNTPLPNQDHPGDAFLLSYGQAHPRMNLRQPFQQPTTVYNAPPGFSFHHYNPSNNNAPLSFPLLVPLNNRNRESKGPDNKFCQH
ncbi:uncharacterized protein LOC106643833 isoform X2 [Copidosoma floridanum]|nr:uncharacterized protein LOC106643833 isoform X2 [Copidosoma floridanum]